MRQRNDGDPALAGGFGEERVPQFAPSHFEGNSLAPRFRPNIGSTGDEREF
jgi:hypothetical protein